MLKGTAAIQRDLGSLGERTSKNTLKIYKKACKLLHLQHENTLRLYRLGTIRLKISFAEQVLEVLADNKLNIGQQCVPAPEADSLLGCINRTRTSRMSKVIISLGIHWAISKIPHPIWAPQYKRDVDQLE